MNGIVFQDLCEAVERLKNDPRIHPNTPVTLAIEVVEHDRNDIPWRSEETAPLASIAWDHALVLSAQCEKNALAR